MVHIFLCGNLLFSMHDGLFQLLQGKVKSKFLESFKETLYWVRVKDQKLQFQSQLMRVGQLLQEQKNA